MYPQREYPKTRLRRLRRFGWLRELMTDELSPPLSGFPQVTTDPSSLSAANDPPFE